MGSLTNHPTALCPTNGRPGRGVDSLTLKALLAVPLTELTAGEYFFCPAAECPTVYYRADGGQHFDEADLREAVFQKHPANETSLVCYCFRHAVGSIRRNLLQTGSSTVVEQITAGIRAGQCACDLRNPQGGLLPEEHAQAGRTA